MTVNFKVIKLPDQRRLNSVHSVIRGLVARRKDIDSLIVISRTGNKVVMDHSKITYAEIMYNLEIIKKQLLEE